MFLPRFSIVSKGLPIICYIQSDRLRGRLTNQPIAQEILQNNFDKIRRNNGPKLLSVLSHANYCIAFVWSAKSTDFRVTLITKYGLHNANTFGPSSYPVFFVDGILAQPEYKYGASVGDFDIVLGLEELHRRAVMKTDSLEEYVFGSGPKLPLEMTEDWLANKH